MAVDRDAYAARQTELLAALLGVAAPPDGFVAEQADAAGRSLRRKRARAVQHAWPALAIALGDRFDERFDAFALTEGAPAFGEGSSDGLAFAWWLRAAGEALEDDVRVELLLARALLVRRGVFAGAIRLAVPHRRLLLVLRLPRLGVRHVALRF